MNNFDDIISQPLTNEDGSLNQACINELEAAIKGIKPAYQRFANDPEWYTPHFTAKKDILGAFACWAVRQSPYDCPENLESVVKYLGACLKKSVQWDCHNFTKMSLCDIHKILCTIMMDGTVSEFEAWNVSKRRKENRQKQETVFCSANDQPDPDDDFIALDALLINVCIFIRDERREFDRFNADFEEKYKALKNEKH